MTPTGPARRLVPAPFRSSVSLRTLSLGTLLLIPLLYNAASLSAQDAPPPAPGPQTGRFSAPLAERSPLSAIRTVCARMGWPYDRIEAQARQQNQELDYDVKKESLEAYVPADYDGKTPYGLLVWVSAGPRGSVVDRYAPILDKHKLIWVGANNAGNNRTVWCRIAVTLDATHHVLQRYHIDPERVYVAGGSGGGRTSSMMGVGFPDVYRGGIYCIGMNFYRTLPASNEPGKFWQKTYSPPELKLLKLARERSVHVALEGDDDLNRFQAKAVIDAYRKDGFKHAYYLEQPNLGHALANEEWFEKAIELLAQSKQDPAKPAQAPAKPEQGLAKPGQDPAKAASTSAATPATPPQAQPGLSNPARSDPSAAAADLAAAKTLATTDPLAGYEALQTLIRQHSKAPEVTEALTLSEQLLARDPALKKRLEDRAEADKILRVARIYLQNRLYAKARERLQTILDRYSETPAAAEARKALAELPAK